MSAAAPNPTAPPPALEFRGVGARSAGRWIVRGVSFAIAPGEMLALLGPSGAGKSTLARLAVGDIAAAEGSVLVDGKNLACLKPPELRRLRSRMPMIYQDPQRSLDPSQSVAAIITEGLELLPAAELRPPGLPGTPRRRRWRRELAAGWLERVGLEADLGERRPRALSGGQRQRVAIARACAVRPALLVADEPVSALDVATGAQILALLAQLQREAGLACLLISHHLPQLSGLAQRLAVMAPTEEGGRVVELGAAAEVLAAPRHPLTRALAAAVPPWPPVAAL